MSNLEFDFDVIVVGGGPAGSTLASLLSQQGIKVCVFEKEEYPRFHIGESLLPYSRDVLEEIGFWQKLDGRYTRKYGAQFVDYRDGSTVFFEFADALDASHPFAFEVQRAQFDRELLAHAEELGATVFQPQTVASVQEFDGYVEVKTSSKTYRCRYVVDATGRDNLMGHALGLREVNHEYNHTAVFAHYDGVERIPGKTEGDIIIGILPDQAWSWYIPFLDQTTSVGVVCKAKMYRAHRDTPEKFIEKMLGTNSGLTARMQNARRISGTSVISNYSFFCRQLVGPRWILIGDAGSFLDPVFSSGVHFAINSAKFASELIATSLREDEVFTAHDRHLAYTKKIKVATTRFRFIIDMFYTTNFSEGMSRVIRRKQSRRAFISILAGDVWNDANPVFSLYDLGQN